ncbi:cytoplasmic tRNA 2-thiolation protein 2 isoform X41 [Apodemus sylvaticus]|uniref:cytoplasmic tRNA 2-thiolation protein 2 isoform X41 n=1 Tax=Apodemus sylvaticus TaxID=10129 RepID=UPI0022430B6D|nr:cytoplasmic tRNA 2-thiolation protein 2 isoform X41 [Apodemus sylvaticus]
MCQAGEDYPGPAQREPPPVPRSSREQKCVKCTEGLPVVVIRAGDAFCRDCFKAFYVHKFRAMLGKNRVIFPGEKVLLSWSGGPSSSSMVWQVLEGLSQDSAKRLRFVPGVIYVDEGAACGQSSEDRAQTVAKVQQILENTGFPWHVVALEEVFSLPPSVLRVSQKPAGTEEAYKAAVDSFLQQQHVLGTQGQGHLHPSHSQEPLGTAGCPRAAQTEALSKLFNSIKTLTAKEELLQTLRTHLTVHVARTHGYCKVMTGESCTRLAIKLMTNLALGRGAFLAWDTGFSDERHGDVVLVRPMRDHTLKEVAFYNHLFGVPSVFTPAIDTKAPEKASIHRLMEAFILRLQTQFPSTVSTVYRCVRALGVQLVRCACPGVLLDRCMCPGVMLDRCVCPGVLLDRCVCPGGLLLDRCVCPGCAVGQVCVPWGVAAGQVCVSWGVAVGQVCVPWGCCWTGVCALGGCCWTGVCALGVLLDRCVRPGGAVGQVCVPWGVAAGQVCVTWGVAVGQVCVPWSATGQVCVPWSAAGQVCVPWGVAAGQVCVPWGVAAGQVCVPWGVAAGQVCAPWGAVELAAACYPSLFAYALAHRTSEKLVKAPREGCTTGPSGPSCLLCMCALDIDTADSATAFGAQSSSHLSQMLPAEAAMATRPCCGAGEGQAQSCHRAVGTRGDPRVCITEQLCYSCRVNMKDLPSLDPLPPYVLAEAQLRSQRGSVSEDIQECLITDDEEEEDTAESREALKQEGEDKGEGL